MKLFLAPDYKNQSGLPSFTSERIDLWKSAAKRLGARYIAFWARGTEDGELLESVGSTLPLRWVMRYITYGMAAHDPEISMGMDATDPLVFDYNTFDNPRYKRYTKTVHSANIGTYSIVVPEQYKDGANSITSFTFDYLPPAQSSELEELIGLAKIVAADVSSDFLAESSDFSLAGARLSARELKIVSLVAQGNNYDQIAHELDISKWTVVAHIKNSKTKLNCSNTSEVIAKATASGLI